jgi:hypothetical protein
LDKRRLVLFIFDATISPLAAMLRREARPSQAAYNDGSKGILLALETLKWTRTPGLVIGAKVRTLQQAAKTLRTHFRNHLVHSDHCQPVRKKLVGDAINTLISLFRCFDSTMTAYYGIDTARIELFLRQLRTQVWANSSVDVGPTVHELLLNDALCGEEAMKKHIVSMAVNLAGDVARQRGLASLPQHHADFRSGDLEALKALLNHDPTLSASSRNAISAVIQVRNATEHPAGRVISDAQHYANLDAVKNCVPPSGRVWRLIDEVMNLT